MTQNPGVVRRGNAEPCAHAVRDVEITEPGRVLMLHCPHLYSLLFDGLPLSTKEAQP
jgi:hypothetical protein